MADDPSALVVPFGKHQGLTVAELLERDPNYAQWLLSQGWLAQRFAELHAAILARGANPDDSPEHNRIQAQFLDPVFQVATLIAAIPEQLQNSMFQTHQWIEKSRQVAILNARDDRDQLIRRIEEYKDAKPPSWTVRYRDQASASLPKAEADLRQAEAEAQKPMPTIKTKATFETSGIDVIIEWIFGNGSKNAVAIEIKPSLGDDFPSVMRQMRRLQARILVIDQYNSPTVPLSTVTEMFFANEQILITLQEIFNQMPDAKNLMGNSA